MYLDKLPVFRSRLEDLMPALELNFDSTPGFGGYRGILGHAMAHPAKMNLLLLKHLVETFTKEGETVLDPMAGSGSTGVLAALHGRNAVCVELEEKFWTWMEQARMKVDASLTPVGQITNICGDARCLSTLLDKADIAITSPPYGNRLSDGKVDDGDTSRMSYQQTGSEHSDNIGHLPLVDVIITSPPYEDTQYASATDYSKYDKLALHKQPWNWAKRYSENPMNIGNKRRDSYLSAMFQVYGELYRVLKEGGLACVVIKPFVRNKKVVDLPYQTWLLMEQCGFKLNQVLKLHLQQESFWRVLYSKKYPNVPKLAYEYILVCVK